MVTCDKCDSALEENSKFCLKCGSEVSVEKIAKMNEEKPTSKAKVWIFKTIAFIIAGFVFSIARVISGAMSGSDEASVGGILLFYGVYALLSGLFLSDKSSVKRGSWVLAFYIIGSIIFTYIVNNSSYGINERIMKTSKSTPLKIDNDTELSSVKLDENNVYYNYKLLNISANDIPSETKNNFANSIKNNLCKEEDFVKIMSYGKIMTVSYYGKDNNLIASSNISKTLCK